MARDLTRTILYVVEEANRSTHVQLTTPYTMKLNAYLIRSTLVGALGGLLFGFDTAVISGTTHLLTIAYSLSSSELGFTVASALIGTVLGAMIAGVPGQRIGRRDSLRIMA